jgi:phenylacetate-CoA ligase
MVSIHAEAVNELSSSLPFWSGVDFPCLPDDTDPQAYAALSSFQTDLKILISQQDALGEYMKEALAALQAHARKHCPFYRHRAEDNSAPLTVLAKQDLHNHFADIRSEIADIQSLRHWMTSGTTGEPTRFLVDPISALSRDLSFWLVQYLIGHENLGAPGKTLMVRLAAGEGTAGWHKPMPFFNGGLLWKACLSEHPSYDPAPVLQLIRTEQPLLLGGDPHALLALARAWQAIYPDEQQYPFQIRAVTCGGNPLTDAGRQILETFFGISVTNVYASSEVGAIASECRHGQMHVHSPINTVTVVDDDGCPLPDGTVGNLLVTNLLNWSFPLISYRTGDIGALDSQSNCSCGSILPVLTWFGGRKERQFTDRTGQLFSPDFLSGLFLKWKLQQYQLIQESPELYTLRYVARAHIPLGDQKELICQLSAKAGGTVQVHYERHDNLITPGRKFQDFISHCLT